MCCHKRRLGQAVSDDAYEPGTDLYYKKDQRESRAFGCCNIELQLSQPRKRQEFLLILIEILYALSRPVASWRDAARYCKYSIHSPFRNTAALATELLPFTYLLSRRDCGCQRAQCPKLRFYTCRVMCGTLAHCGGRSTLLPQSIHPMPKSL